MASIGRVTIGSRPSEEVRQGMRSNISGGLRIATRPASVNFQPFTGRNRDNGLSRISHFDSSYKDDQWDFYFKMRD